jgi:hypothetical protein
VTGGPGGPVLALDLESLVWRYAGAKEDAIRSRLGVSPVRHHQRIARLIDDPAAVAYAPATIRRLRAVRDGGRPRSARRPSWSVV